MIPPLLDLILGALFLAAAIAYDVLCRGERWTA